MGKGEIAQNEQFLLFPNRFLPLWRTFCHFHQTQNGRLQTLSVWEESKICRLVKSMVFRDLFSLNPFQNMPLFLCAYSTNLLKTLGKGEIARNK